MTFAILASKWCDLRTNSLVIIVTDNDRFLLAQTIQSQLRQSSRVINIDKDTDYTGALFLLSPWDLVTIP